MNRTEAVFYSTKKGGENLRQDKAGGWGIRLALGWIVVMLMMLLAAAKRLPPQVPLWYSRPWGEPQLANPWQLLWLPGLSLIALIVNSAIANRVFKEDKLLARMLMTIAAGVGFMAWFTLTRIFLLIF